MSRNGSGTYTLPSGNPVVSGTLIEAAWANNTLSDIASALTDSLSRSGQGGMTASLRLFDGTLTVPGLAWSSETTTGFYRAGSGDMRLVVTGSDVMQFLTTGVSVTGTLSSSGNFAINTDKFTVAASSGNTAVAGTLGVTGALTAASATVNGNLSAWNHFVPDAINAARFGYNGSFPFIDMSGGSNFLSFGTAGAERMRVNSTGGVSINTTNMRGSLLSVEQTGTSVKLATFSNAVDSDFEIKSTASGVMTIGSSAGSLAFQTQNSERMRLDTSGNLGLGVTPSAWAGGAKAFEIAGGSVLSFGTGALELWQNAYFDGTTRYKVSAAASTYVQTSGQHRWFIAPSGTAGNVASLTQAMTLSNSGNNTALVLQNPAASQTTTFSTADLYYDFSAAGAVVWRNRAGNAESARIDSSGNLLVGTTSATAKVSIVPSGADALALLRAAFVGVRLTPSADVYMYDTNGNWTNTIRAGSFANMSDVRFKDVRGSLEPVLGKLNSVETIRYTVKSGDGKEQIGFSAQNLKEVFPEFVSGAEDDIGYGVNYAQFAAVLTKAIQEQQAIIEQLKADVAALKTA